MSNPVPRARAPRLAAVIFVVFLAVSAARLYSEAVDLDWLKRASTFALMPSLALWVLVRRGPALVVLALIFSAGGDVLLGYGTDLLFLAGMGSFGVAHVCYVSYFVRSGALRGVRRRWYLVVAYAAALAGLVVWLWPGLGDLRVPVTVYGLLLTATALTSAGAGLWTGLGGALFFVSDVLIAAGIADRPRPDHPGMWIMVTYIAAQILLATGAVRRSAASGGGSRD